MPQDDLGLNLNVHRNISVLEAETAEELRDLLRSITRPYTIKSIYGLGNKHYAWIIGDKKIQQGD